jgi:hypothetical protein
MSCVEPRRRRLIIDLDTLSEPIQGWLAEEGRQPRPFLGWLELSSAIERARQAGAPPGKEHPSGEGEE